MRKVLIGFVVFILVLIVGVIIFIKTVDLNQYLPQIVQKISQAVGRDVKVGKLGINLSLKNGVVVDIAQVSLAEDGRYSKDPFIFIEHIHVGVGVVPLIMKRQIEVTSIVIQSPKVVIIRDSQGTFNYESMLNAKPASTAPASVSDNSASSGLPSDLPKLLVNSFAINNAKIVYQDMTEASKINVSVDKIDAKVLGFSLQEPFKIILDAALFSSVQNLHLDASSRIDVQLQQARLDDAHFRFDLSSLDVARLNQSVPATVPAGIGKGLAGTIEAVISQMVVGAKGPLVLSLEGKIAGVRIPLKMLAVPIEGLSAKIDMTESKVKVSDFIFNLSGGKIRGQMNVRDYMVTQHFDLSASVDKVLIQEVVDQSKAPVKMKGAVSGTAQIKGQGFAPEGLDRITGQMQMDVAQAQLVNVDIVKAILEKIPGLSAFAGVVGSLQPSNGAQSSEGNITNIDSIQAKAHIETSKIFLDDAHVASARFKLSALGTIGFDQEVDLQADFALSKESSQGLIDSAQDMGRLLDKDQQIRFPVKITGKIPDLNYAPDMAYISKVLAGNIIGDELEKAFEKNPEAKKFLDIFTGGKDSSGEAGQQVPDVQEGASEEADDKASSGRQLLKNLLDKAF